MVICATAISCSLTSIKRMRLKLHHSVTVLVTNDQVATNSAIALPRAPFVTVTQNSKKSLRQQNEEGLRLLSPIEGMRMLSGLHESTCLNNAPQFHGCQRRLKRL
jgi:hypothetical protein